MIDSFKLTQEKVTVPRDLPLLDWRKTAVLGKRRYWENSGIGSHILPRKWAVVKEGVLEGRYEGERLYILYVTIHLIL